MDYWLNNCKSFLVNEEKCLCMSQMTESLGRASQGLKMYCHDLEVMSSNPVLANLGCVLLQLKSFKL